MVLHYNKLANCKKTEWGEMVQKDLQRVTGGAQARSCNMGTAVKVWLGWMDGDAMWREQR